jgi:hypothetical protein
MTPAADAYALHYRAGRGAVEIIDRVAVFMDAAVKAAVAGRAEIGHTGSQCTLALCRQAIVETRSDVRMTE